MLQCYVSVLKWASHLENLAFDKIVRNLSDGRRKTCKLGKPLLFILEFTFLLL